MGDGWADGVHPEDLPDCLRDFLKSFHARQPLRLEYRLRRHDGDYRWIIDEGRPFYEQDGTFAGYIGACFDVTERKIAEEALRKSERRFAAIMDNMPGFAWIKDAEGRYLYQNNTPAQSFPDPSAWRGKTDFDLWPAEMAVQYRANDQMVLSSGVALHTVEPFRGADGVTRHVLVSKFPIFDANGAVTQVGGVGIDVTDRKQAEVLLENSKDQLRALTAKLQTVREEESIRLSREIHDELGHALTTLNMDLTWVQHKLEGEKSPLLRSQLSRRMKAMMASLETMARTVQRIATELRPGMLDDLGLTSTLEWQAEEFQGRTGVRCHWETRPSSVTLDRAQATALFRIFQEILSNVARHAAAQSVKLILTQSNDELVLQVADDGKGFNEKKLLDHTSLGLLGMRERAALIGGLVEIRTRRGKGTTVTVTCPLAVSKMSGKPNDRDSNA
jgi:PAS domain S-box-containing protein